MSRCHRSLFFLRCLIVHLNHLRPKASLQTSDWLCFESEWLLFVEHFGFIENLIFKYFITLIRVLNDSSIIGETLARAITLIYLFWMIHISLWCEEKTFLFLLKFQLLLKSHRLRTFSNRDFFYSNWIEFLSPEINNLAGRTGWCCECSSVFDALIVFDGVDVNLPPNFSIDFSWERSFMTLLILHGSEQLLWLNFGSNGPLTRSKRSSFLLLVCHWTLRSRLFFIWLSVGLENLDVKYRLVYSSYITFVDSDRFTELLATGFPSQNLILELFLRFNNFFEFLNFIFKLFNILLVFLLGDYTGWRLSW